MGNKEAMSERGGSAPQRLGLPDYPEPTSFGLTKDFYMSADNIVNRIREMLLLEPLAIKESAMPHDIPGKWFKGPF